MNVIVWNNQNIFNSHPEWDVIIDHNSMKEKIYYTDSLIDFFPNAIEPDYKKISDFDYIEICNNGDIFARKNEALVRKTKDFVLKTFPGLEKFINGDGQ